MPTSYLVAGRVIMGYIMHLLCRKCKYQRVTFTLYLLCYLLFKMDSPWLAPVLDLIYTGCKSVVCILANSLNVAEPAVLTV